MNTTPIISDRSTLNLSDDFILWSDHGRVHLDEARKLGFIVEPHDAEVVLGLIRQHLSNGLPGKAVR